MKYERLMFGVLCSTVLVLIGASFSVAAETVTDPTGDVWHHPNTGNAGLWTGTVVDKTNIDITQVTETVNGNKLTLNITVAGFIQHSNVQYQVHCNTTNTQYYMSWGNGAGNAIEAVQGGGVVNNANFTVSGHTVSAVFTMYGYSTTVVDLWGTAIEYTNSTYEQWGDWAPNSKIPFNTTIIGNTGNTTGGNPGNTTGGNTGNNNGGGKKTPGFELLPVIAAVAITIIFLRRR